MSDIMQLITTKEERKINIQINHFKQLFNDLKDTLPMGGEEDFVKMNDLTGMIINVIHDVISAGEKINWVVRGEVIGGKSTVMDTLVEEINVFLMKRKELFFNHIELKANKDELKSFDNYKMIVADQIEFITLIKRQLWNCGIGIDEFNRLGETGANSSIESTLYQTYSDIFAQQRVHTISCAPSIIGDSNCWLILDVIGKDKINMITRVKVIYRDIITGQQLAIGRADIFVGDVINKDWYKRYVKKKFRRMELLQKHNIRKISQLETAKIILDIYEELKDKARIMRIDTDVMLSISKEIIDKNQYIASLIAEGDIVSGARSLLSIETSIGKMAKSIVSERNKSEPDDKKVKKLLELKDKEEKLLDHMIQTQKRRNAIYREYLSIK